MKTTLLTTSNGTRETATRTIDVTISMPETLKEWQNFLGAEDIVCAAIRKSYVIALQAFIRGLFKREERMSDDDIRAEAEKWRMQPRTRTSKADKVLKLADDMTPDERKELIKKLKKDMANTA